MPLTQIRDRSLSWLGTDTSVIDEPVQLKQNNPTKIPSTWFH